MGVHGLWRLIEPSGKPVPLESLENKILAVDISIWLHQAIKGFQDSRGAPLPNAHLLGIYHRVCKLLYFRVKPVFVFDGGVPVLKKQTIAKRNQQKTKILNDATDIQTKLLRTLLKHSAVNKVISEKTTSPTKTSLLQNDDNKDMFILPTLSTEELDSTLDSSSSNDESSSSPTKQWDLHTIDEKSEHFRSLPADVRHEILTEIMETRKQSSWGKIHELPSESNHFSKFQMNRLLKRYSVQVSLEEAEKEMGGHTLSLGELESLLNEEGIVNTSESTARNKIASNENTRYLLIKDVKKAMEKAKKDNENLKTNDKHISEICEEKSISQTTENVPFDKEFDRDLAAAIQLSLQDQPSTSKEAQQNCSYLEHFNDGDFDSGSESDELPLTRLKQAKSYMMEYSGLTPNEIEKIINSNEQILKFTNKQNTLSEKDNHIEKNKLTEIDNNISLINEEKTQINTIELISKNEISITKICPEIPDTPNIKTQHCTKETSQKEEQIETQNVSDSDSNDFIDVQEKKIKNILSGENKSDSDDSDFIEINSSAENTNLDINTEKSLEIVINPKENLNDDIFSDIFAENKIVDNASNIEEVKSNLDNLVETNIDIVTEIKSNLENTNVPEVTKNPDINLNKKEEIEKPYLTVEDLNKMKSDLTAEQEQLMLARNSKQRMARNITDQMYQEAQELLELFGVPYIIAPMEAEAQCAFLNDINLTDGTITDDSDIWLFGGKTVYKNFFNHNKHVLEFRAESIEHHFKLTREQLILLALLVGSDYTLGIQGIGPVTALEILAAFPPFRNTKISVLTQTELISGLREFRNWLSDGKTVGVGRTSLRGKLKNVNISDGFPSVQVVQAYMQPEVETCADKFTWGKPDIVSLIDFAKEKFGWTKMKSEEILKPVIRKLEDKNIQKSIKDYFVTKHKIDVDFAEHKLSKRVKTAVKRIGNTENEPTNDDKINRKTTRKENSCKTKNKSRRTGASKNEIATPANSNKKMAVKSIEILHTKESIPQREKDKYDSVKNKLKAIEVFRKSRKGPGFVKKTPKIIKPLKKDAELSESSSSD